MYSGFHTYREGITCVFFINSSIFPRLTGRVCKSRILSMVRGFRQMNTTARPLYR